MSSSYVDLATIFDPASGSSPPATWGDQIRENDQYFYERVEKVLTHTVLPSAASTISSGTLPTVPNGWRLRVLTRLQHESGAGVDIGMRFNGDGGANYVRQYLLGQDTTAAADAVVANTSWLFTVAGNDSSNRWSMSDAQIFDYLGTYHKQGMCMAWSPANLTTLPIVLHTGCNWANTAPITSVSILTASGNLVGGSSMTVLATPVPV